MESNTDDFYKLDNFDELMDTIPELAGCSEEISTILNSVSEFEMENYAEGHEKNNGESSEESSSISFDQLSCYLDNKAVLLTQLAKLGKGAVSKPEMDKNTRAHKCWKFLVLQTLLRSDAKLHFEGCFFNSQEGSNEREAVVYNIQWNSHNYPASFSVFLGNDRFELVWANLLWTLCEDYLTDAQKNAFESLIQWTKQIDNNTTSIRITVCDEKIENTLKTKQYIECRRVFVTKPREEIPIVDAIRQLSNRSEDQSIEYREQNRPMKKRRRTLNSSDSPCHTEADNQGIWTARNGNNNSRELYTPLSVTVDGIMQSRGYFTLSDERKKKNITPFQIPPNIDEVTIWSYKYIDDGEEGDNVGYMAQKVEQVDKHSIRHTSEGVKMVDYTRLHTMKIQRLESNDKATRSRLDNIEARQNNQEKESTALKTENVKLQSRLCRLCFSQGENIKGILFYAKHGNELKKKLESTFTPFVIDSIENPSLREFVLDIVSLYPAYMGGFTKDQAVAISTSIDLVKNLGNNRIRIKASFCLAELRRSQNESEESTNYYKNCRMLIQEGGEESTFLDTYEHGVLFGLAKNCESQGDRNNAIMHLKPCLKICERLEAQEVDSDNIQYLITTWSTLKQLADNYIAVRCFKAAKDLLVECQEKAKMLTKCTMDEAADYTYHTEIAIAKLYVTQFWHDNELSEDLKFARLKDAELTLHYCLGLFTEGHRFHNQAKYNLMMVLNPPTLLLREYIFNQDWKKAIDCLDKCFDLHFQFTEMQFTTLIGLSQRLAMQILAGNQPLWRKLSNILRKFDLIKYIAPFIRLL